MAILPVLSGKELVKILEKEGFQMRKIIHDDLEMDVDSFNKLLE